MGGPAQLPGPLTPDGGGHGSTAGASWLEPWPVAPTVIYSQSRPLDPVEMAPVPWARS